MIFELLIENKKLAALLGSQATLTAYLRVRYIS